MSHGDSLNISAGVQEFHTLSVKNSSEIFFTEEEKKTIQEIIFKYPQKDAAVMPALWIAQEKFGWLSTEAIYLVADTIGIPRANAIGVASFYTMYFKKPVGKVHVAICTNISCKLVGAYKLYEQVKDKYHLENWEVTSDGEVSLEEAECLGSCGTAPVVQVSNEFYIEHATIEKIEELIRKK